MGRMDSTRLPVQGWQYVTLARKTLGRPEQMDTVTGSLYPKLKLKKKRRKF